MSMKDTGFNQRKMKKRESAGHRKWVKVRRLRTQKFSWSEDTKTGQGEVSRLLDHKYEPFLSKNIHSTYCCFFRLVSLWYRPGHAFQIAKKEKTIRGQTTVRPEVDGSTLYSYAEYDTKLHLRVSVHFGRSGKYGADFHSHYFQVHS